MENELVRFDWAVKELLRIKSNFGILEGFLSELLKKNIKIQNILESELDSSNDRDKYNRIDIVAEDENAEINLIEVYMDREADFLSKILSGNHGVIRRRITEDKSFFNVKKIYSVNILYFDLGCGDDYVYKGSTNFIGIHKKSELNLPMRHKKVYTHELAGKIYIEYYFIRLKQFDNTINDKLDEWIYVLKNTEVKNKFTAKGLSEAEENLSRLKLSHENQAKYKRFLENLHYEASMVESSKMEGRMEGRIEAKNKMEGFYKVNLRF